MTDLTRVGREVFEQLLDGAGRFTGQLVDMRQNVDDQGNLQGYGT